MEGDTINSNQPLASSNTSQVLPVGWVEKLDKNRNRVYYVNKFTKKSQWDFPLFPAMPVAPPLPPSSSRSNNSTNAATLPDATSSGHNKSTTGNAEQESNLKNGQLEKTNKEQLNRIDQQQAQRHKEQQYQGATGRSDLSVIIEQDESMQSQGGKKSDTKSSSNDDNTWVIKQSRKHAGKVFYYNSVTKKSSWNLPPNAIVISEQDAISKRKSIETSEKSVRLFSIKNEDLAVKAAQSGSQEQLLEQFPFLKKAFEEIELAKEQLKKQMQEHDERVARDLSMIHNAQKDIGNANGNSNVNKRMSHIRNASSSSSSNSQNDKRVSTSTHKRISSSLTGQLDSVTNDLKRRSLQIAKRHSIASAGNQNAEFIRSVADTLKAAGVETGPGLEEKNIESRHQKQPPSSAQSTFLANTANSFIAKGATPYEKQESSTALSTWIDGDDDDSDGGNDPNDNSRMAGIEQTLKYAKKEMEAQKQARAEAAYMNKEGEGDENGEGVGGYYKVLGLKQAASLSEIKKAYHKLMLQYHPDKCAPDQRDLAAAVSDQIQTAYRVLSDPWEREIYDWFQLEQYLVHLKVLQCFKNYILGGFDIVKHPRKGWPRKRLIWLNSDCTMIYAHKQLIPEITPALEKKVKGISIKSIKNVTRGISTDVFQRTGKKSKQDRYFSIVADDRTLDLEAPSKEMAEFIGTRITLLIIDLKKDMPWMERYYEELDEKDQQLQQ